MKIGGGVDIHNLDAYLSLLLIVTAYIVFRKYTSETEENLSPFTFPWGLVCVARR